MQNAATTKPTTAPNSPAQELAEIRQRVDTFADRDAAFAYAARPGKRLWVMLGGDGRYWVARPVDCMRPERMGYEFAG